MKIVLLLAGSSLAVDGLKQKDRKLRGTQSETLNPPTPSWGSDIEPVVTLAPTPWAGDSWGGLSTGGWGTDGWEGSWGGSWEGNVETKVSGGSASKSNKINYVQYSVGGKSDKGSLYVAGTSSKSDTGNSINISGISSKSNKGYGLNVSGLSSKSNKGYGINIAGVSSKSNKGASGIYINVAGGKSNKGSFTFSGGSSKANKDLPVQPVNPIEPTDGWNNDGYVEVVRGKWVGDGHVTPLITPNPTPVPTWKGDAHPLVTPPPTWKGDMHPPTNKPVFSVVTPAPSPAPSTCEERMVWHPNPDYTKCTNDENYSLDSPYVYISLELCCNALFGTPTCDYEDICTSNEPTLSPVTPAPTPCDAQLFFFDGESCTNEIYIADATAYNTVVACCNLNFGIGSLGNGKCSYTDKCNTPMPSDNPTVKPSNSPTAKPTSKPTKTPTNNPTSKPIDSAVTPAPSPAPTTCEERLWHPNPYFKFCINDSNYPQSWTSPDAFDSYFYATLADCCISVFGTFSCDHVDICKTPSPSESPVTEEPTPFPTLEPSPKPTKKPTPEPIEPVITPAPSPAPTTCEERKWCITETTDGQLICSNDYHLHDKSSGTDEYHYSSLEECCEAGFGGSKCFFYDVCSTPMPSDEPTPNPTKKPSKAPVEPLVTPAPSPAPTSCEERSWYASTTEDNKLVCSNGYAVSMDSNDVNAMMGIYYNNLQECCEAVFEGGICEFIDVCETLSPSTSPTDSPVTPAPTPCGSQVFFFDGNTCTNEFFVADTAAYDSLLACCNAAFGLGSFMNGSCDYVDICNTEPPSPSPVPPEPTPFPVTPAPTPCEAQVFFFDGNTCSNEFFVADASAYSSAVSCCNASFGLGSFMNGSCNYVDICNTEPPSPSPVTPEPTEFPVMNTKPTPFPSSASYVITLSPTEDVTPAPTPCEAKVFFFDGNTCSNEFDIADAPAYTSVVICCNTAFGPGSFMGGSCNYVDICNTEPPSPSPVTPEPTEFPVMNPKPTPFPSPAPYIKTLPPTEEITTLSPTPQPITPVPSPFPSLLVTQPPTPEPTPMPSDEIITPSPTPMPSDEIITPSPTPFPSSLFTEEPTQVTMSPTPVPSFGATPTVSKETTGPPTMYAGRGTRNMV